MKTIKDRVDNFFKWVKGTELVELTEINVNEDPVRPELDLNWRLFAERKIYGLKYEDNIEAIVCVAYTVWSRKRGAGREIINKLLEFIKEKPYIKQLVTLSPLTPMATHFHMKNGAKLISINSTTQNFEYQWSVH